MEIIERSDFLVLEIPEMFNLMNNLHQYYIKRIVFKVSGRLTKHQGKPKWNASISVCH